MSIWFCLYHALLKTYSIWRGSNCIFTVFSYVLMPELNCYKCETRCRFQLHAAPSFMSVNSIDFVLGKIMHLFLVMQRNNLPAVRQYLETFAIQIYLKFPSLVRSTLFSYPLLLLHIRKHATKSSNFIHCFSWKL